MRWRRLFQGIAVAAVAMLFASACLSEEGGGGGGADTGRDGDKQVEILFGFGGDQSKGFEEAMKEWAKSYGVNHQVHRRLPVLRHPDPPAVQGNNLPDIALFPQPGVMMDFASSGKMQDLGTMLDIEQLKSTLVPGELDTGTRGRQDLRLADEHERQEPGLVSEEGVRGQGLHRSRPPSPSWRR